MPEKQQITVTAKCPKCKKTKKFTNDTPLNYTPYCPNGCGMPMFVQNISVKTLKTNIKTKWKTKK